MQKNKKNISSGMMLLHKSQHCVINEITDKPHKAQRENYA